MAIDYEKEEKRAGRPVGGRRSPLRGITRTAGAAHQVAALSGAADQLGFGGFSQASPVGAAIAIGESLEQGLTSDDLDERMERFPELREVEVATGAGARFPELIDRTAPDATAADVSADEPERFSR